ncbi:MAG: hypothetical protein ACREBU_01180 [Nitrososphaera sp.]
MMVDLRYLMSFALFLVILATLEIGLAQAQRDAAMVSGISGPIVKDAQGNLLSTASTGEIIILSVNVTNNENVPLPFVILIESRDEIGVTQFLEFHIGTLQGNRSSEVGISWKPAEAGNYQLRTFLISGFDSPEVLTGVQTSDFVITQ